MASTTIITEGLPCTRHCVMTNKTYAQGAPILKWGSDQINTIRHLEKVKVIQNLIHSPLNFRVIYSFENKFKSNLSLGSPTI